MNKKPFTVVHLLTHYTSQVHQVFLHFSTCIHQPDPLDMWTERTLEQGLGFCPVTFQCLSESRLPLYSPLPNTAAYYAIQRTTWRGSEDGVNLSRSSHFLHYHLLASAWSTLDSNKMVLKTTPTLWKTQNTNPPISKILQKDIYLSLWIYIFHSCS